MSTESLWRAVRILSYRPEAVKIFLFIFVLSMFMKSLLNANTWICQRLIDKLTGDILTDDILCALMT